MKTGSTILLNCFFLLTAIIILLYCCSSCGVPTTTSCPNCSNGKPIYYNKEKARDARRLARQVNKNSAVGGKTFNDPMNTDSKGSKSKKQKPELPGGH